MAKGKQPSKRSKLAKAEEAKQLMRHPLMIDFFERAEQQIFERWRESLQGGADARELLFHQQLGLSAFREFMETTLIDGEMAKRDLGVE